LTLKSEGGRQIDGSSGLADTTFLIGQRDHEWSVFTH
jgi:hypothetical protein